LTLIEGFAFWNSAICALNCAVASLVLPGISDATLIVTVCEALFDPLFAAALEMVETASRPATATIATVRMDFIVLWVDFIVLSFP
jgi:hypothetical protein